MFRVGVTHPENPSKIFMPADELSRAKEISTPDADTAIEDMERQNAKRRKDLGLPVSPEPSSVHSSSLPPARSDSVLQQNSASFMSIYPNEGEPSSIIGSPEGSKDHVDALVDIQAKPDVDIVVDLWFDLSVVSEVLEPSNFFMEVGFLEE